MAKTNPIGVRFDKDLLGAVKDKYGASPQKALSLYEDTYRKFVGGTLVLNEPKTKVTNATATRPMSNYTVNTLTPPLGIGNPVADIADVEEWKKTTKARIEKLETELKHPPSPPPSIGLAMWRKIRETEIKELQNQINALQ